MHKLTIASPSCVIPDTVAKNAIFLAERVEEVGLCFFETKACLAYGENDLPASLAKLPLRWHVHLPVDLWNITDESAIANNSGFTLAEPAIELIQRASFLKPRFAVLHPPTYNDGTALNTSTQEKLLLSFAENWYSKVKIPLFLENICNAPLGNLDPKLFNLDHGPFGVCLDLGHMLGFSQTEIILQSTLLNHVGLVHISAPGKRDEHLSLKHLTDKEFLIMRQTLKQIPANACHMLEIFNWVGIEQSYAILKKLLD